MKILLDTNAILWLLIEHPRVASLLDTEELRISPVSLLEIQYLFEVGRLQFAGDGSLQNIRDDDRWQLDSPSCENLFKSAMGLSWTRDPFDRLLVAHAALRGWRFATGDRHLKAHLQESEQLPL